MPDAGRESLEGLIERIRSQYSFDVDFTSTDPVLLPEIVRRLRDAALVFNLLAISEFGGRSGKEREEGLTELIIGYPPLGRLSEDEVVDFCIALSKGAVRDIEIIAAHIAYLWGYSSEPGHISSPE